MNLNSYNWVNVTRRAFQNPVCTLLVKKSRIKLGVIKLAVNSGRQLTRRRLGSEVINDKKFSTILAVIQIVEVFKHSCLLIKPVT
jgi:hypothetical protein